MAALAEIVPATADSEAATPLMVLSILRSAFAGACSLTAMVSFCHLCCRMWQPSRMPLALLRQNSFFLVFATPGPIDGIVHRAMTAMKARKLQKLPSVRIVFLPTMAHDRTDHFRSADSAFAAECPAASATDGNPASPERISRVPPCGCWET